MVIFRENTEDIYAGLEVEEGTPEAEKLIKLLHDEFGVGTLRPDSGVGIKPISEPYPVEAVPGQRQRSERP